MSYLYLIIFKSATRNDVVKVGRTTCLEKRLSALKSEYCCRYKEEGVIACLFVKNVSNPKYQELILINAAAKKFRTDTTKNGRYREWMELGTIRKVKNLGRKYEMNNFVLPL